MRRYDPRFLTVLAITQECRAVTLETARRYLGKTHLILHELTENVENQKLFGLRDATINAARQVLIWVDPFIKDSTFPGSDVNAFDGWKALFVPALEHFESALSVDIEALPIFLVEPKRGYAVNTLLDDIEDVLPEADRGVLSDFARDNMQEAGACLAFHRFTACGYHLARALEDVARRYNYAISGNRSPYIDRNGETRHRALAQIGGELQQVLDNWKYPDEPRLLSLVVPTLRNFCRIYRTPLSHADPQLKELEASDAEVAFGHAIAAISTMLEDTRAGGPHFKRRVVWR